MNPPTDEMPWEVLVEIMKDATRNIPPLKNASKPVIERRRIVLRSIENIFKAHDCSENIYTRELPLHKFDEITIKDLTIPIKSTIGVLPEDNFSLQIHGNIQFQFINCKFVSADPSIYHKDLIINVKPESAFRMQNCSLDFSGSAHLIFTKETQNIQISDTHKSIIRLENNQFKINNLNILTDISLSKSNESGVGQSDKDNVTEVFIDRNKIYQLNLNCDGRIEIRRKNTIEKFFTVNIDADIYYSQSNEVVHNESNADSHKYIFQKLHEKETNQHNHFQAQIFKREVLLCEQQLRLSESFWDSWQDRLIFWWGDIVSQHGISWVRPGLILILVNAWLSMPITGLDYNKGTIEVWVTFFNMFKPLYYPDSNNFFVLSIFAFQKILFAGLVYEAIRAGRRFSRQ